MSVALVSTPDNLALTKGGRMVYQFSGSGRYQTTGLAAVATLYLLEAIEEGAVLLLRWNGQSYSLTFRDAPSAPNEFSTGDGSATYAADLIAQLQTYFPIREDFILTPSDPSGLPGIDFTANKPGAAYNLSIPNLAVGMPYSLFPTVYGADAILRTQYSVYAELWLQKVGTTGADLDTHYERVFSPMIETDAGGNATWDVGNVLHTHLTADLPNWNLPGAPFGGQYSERKYYVCYGEAWGAPMQVGRVVRDTVRRAYLGGSDYVRRAGGGLAFLSGRNSTPQDDTALRFGAALRYVRPDEPQFLTFLNSRTDEAAVLLRIVRTYDNDSTDTRLPLLSAQAQPYGHKLTFGAGPTQQDLLNDVPSGRTLREYTAQLVRPDGTALSIAYRYILNYDYQPYTRYFAYLNSLGVLDTLATFGKGSTELNRFFEQAERYVPALYEVPDGQFVDYNLSLQQSLEVATGFRSEAELRGWHDFYRSPQRFHLVDGEALPISITSKSIKQAKDGDTLFAHLFQFVYLFRDDFYSAPTGEVGNTLPPLGFVPGGNITIEQPQLIRSIDDTVPDAVRELTAPIINGFKQAVAWGNHALGGYLNQAAGSLLFRRKDQLISWINDLKDRPTTRDQAGLTDIPTRADLFKISRIKPTVSTWVGSDIPEEPL